jgi:hypothetical protein
MTYKYGIEHILNMWHSKIELGAYVPKSIL